MTFTGIGAAILITALSCGTSDYDLVSADVAARGLTFVGDCTSIEWRDTDGYLFIPIDINGDKRIDCGSDVELGA
jgi:hypothetical protein